MPDLLGLYGANALLAWIGCAAALLAVEVITGSGWLLWASASAAAVGGVVGLTGLGAPGALALFAGLTLVSTLLARRYMPRGVAASDGDINDNSARVLGRTGAAVDTFQAGRGRIAVDGKEWPAELVAGGELAIGATAEVVEIDGLKLKVRPL